jgi:hypothetical protein
MLVCTYETIWCPKSRWSQLEHSPLWKSQSLYQLNDISVFFVKYYISYPYKTADMVVWDIMEMRYHGNQFLNKIRLCINVGSLTSHNPIGLQGLLWG